MNNSKANTTSGPRTMIVEEELDRLEEDMRRLRVEYDTFFNGASRRPPNETQSRVEIRLKRLGDCVDMRIAERFRYNNLVQRYALFTKLWRQKMRGREQGLARDMQAISDPAVEKPASFRIKSEDDPISESSAVNQLLSSFLEAKRACGENTENLPADKFTQFLRQKTQQLKRDFGCEQVEYVIEVEGNQVKLKAKAV